MAKQAGAGETITVAGHTVKLTNTGKLMWEEEGITKRDLVDYYVQIAPSLLPHIAGRPLTLKPYPDGIRHASFFIRTRPQYAPRWIDTATYTPEHGREGTIHPVVANNAATLAWMANHAVIEIHPWLVKRDEMYRPDLVVFDLDPPHDAPYAAVLEVASELSKLLAEMDLVSFIKTSGKFGAHLFIPVAREYTFDQTRAFAERIGKLMQERMPKQVTTDYNQYRQEENRTLTVIDYSQNSVAKSTVAPYSLRPVPGATVSTPLTEDEVRRGNVDPGAFTIKTIFQRLDRLGDLWQALPGMGQHLPEEARR